MKAFLSRARFLAAAGTIAICAAARGSVPPVYLNHVVIYLSAETYDALKASPLIRKQFSDSREATFHADGGSINYTGLYLGGMNTYLEIFANGFSELSHKVEPAGRVFFAMWIDHRTQLPAIHKGLPMVEMGTMRDAQNQPSYDYIGDDPAKTAGVNSFVFGLYPDGIVRSAASRTLRSPPYRQDRFLHDIVACTVTVGIAERDILIRTFRAYGYAIRDDGQHTVANGPEFTLTILPIKPGERRSASIEMSLNRINTGNKSYRMGDSELRFEGRRATLSLTFPQVTRAAQ
jgi:hypothetical protein